MRILVVDDNDDVGSIFVELLTKSSTHEVRLARDPDGALTAAKNWNPDCVLLDLGLPRPEDGYRLARQLRAAGAWEGAGKIFAVSGYAADEQALSDAGIDGHFLKPFKMRAVLDRLDT